MEGKGSPPVEASVAEAKREHRSGLTRMRLSEKYLKTTMESRSHEVGCRGFWSRRGYDFWLQEDELG